MPVGQLLRKRLRDIERGRREVRVFAAARQHRTRPVLAPNRADPAL